MSNQSEHVTTKNNDTTRENVCGDRQVPNKMGISKIKLIIIFGVATVAIITGTAVGLYWETIVDKILNHELILSPTSQSFSMWEETPIPMYLKIYLFNWTNPKEFSKNSKVKPHFTEMGPYVFREIDYKVNRVWNTNETVTFQQKRVWHFMESMSKGSLDDKITNLNPVATSLLYKVRNKPRLIQLAVNTILRLFNETLTVTKSVNELLFLGYEDKLLEFAKKLNISGGIPYDRFGWFYGRNESETYDGVFNMWTGESSLFDTGILKRWNYMDKSPYYSDDCGLINGTLGDLWPTFPKDSIIPAEKYIIPVFAPDVCSLIYLEYHNISEHNQLIGRKFVSTSKMFDNGTKVPSRSCYCKDVECQPSGTLNVSSCKFDAPAFVSLPHFYLADDSYASMLSGMNPDREKHQFSVVIQPDVGIPLQVRARLQLNLLVQPSQHVQLFANVPRTYVPMLWFSQEADLTNEYTKKIKFIFTLPLLGHVTFFGIAGIGILLIFIGIGVCVRGLKKADDAQRLLSKTEENNVIPNQ